LSLLSLNRKISIAVLYHFLSFKTVNIILQQTLITEAPKKHKKDILKKEIVSGLGVTVDGQVENTALWDIVLHAVYSDCIMHIVGHMGVRLHD